MIKSPEDDEQKFNTTGNSARRLLLNITVITGKIITIERYSSEQEPLGNNNQIIAVPSLNPFNQQVDQRSSSPQTYCRCVK